MPEKKPLAKRRKHKRKQKSKTVDCLIAVEQENRDRAFVSEYIKTMDPDKAAKAIGLDLTSPMPAWNYLHKVSVQKILKEEMDKRTDASGATQERIINELAALAFSSITDFVAFSGHDVVLVNSGSLTRIQASAIQNVQSKPTKDGGTVVAIKMYDKLKALELLMRWKGMISTDSKGAFGAADSHTMAERVMSNISKMSKATVTGEGDNDKNA